MAHFAKLDANNAVEQVIVIDNDDIIDATTGKEAENIGIAFSDLVFPKGILILHFPTIAFSKEILRLHFPNIVSLMTY